MLSNNKVKYILLINMLNDAGCTLFAEELSEKLEMPLGEMEIIGEAMACAGFINYDKELGAFTLIKDVSDMTLPTIVPAKKHAKDKKVMLFEDCGTGQCFYSDVPVENKEDYS